MRELCRVCHGNGVVKISGGVSTCNHCDGNCWEPEMLVAREVSPLDYPCPTCGVPPGVQCEFKRLFDGRTSPRQFAAGVTGRTHASRVRRARKGDRETTSGAVNP